MFRSALVAVLAVALSSTIAAAQSADRQGERDILSEIGFDVTELDPPADWDIDALATIDVDITAPEPVEIAVVSTGFELTELAAPAQDVDASATGSSFFKTAELMFTRHFDRAQDLVKGARTHASNLLDRARTQPRFAMYATLGALQTLDLMTTSRALNAGHNEANPLFKSGNRSTMVLAKAAGFGLQLYITERVAERRPKTAKWMMVATNVFMSAVVLNNFAIGGTPSR